MDKVVRYSSLVLIIINALAIITASIKIMDSNYDIIPEAVISGICIIILCINLYIINAERRYKDESS